MLEAASATDRLTEAFSGVVVAEGRPNLVSPTTYARGLSPARNVYGANVIEYRDGGGEATVYYDHRTHPDRDRLTRRGQVKAGEAADPDRSRAEAVRRARATVRRVARAGQLRYMWTLTFPGAGVADLGASQTLLRGWLRGGKKGHDPNTRFFGGSFVAVPELHPDGHGWHWHLLTDRRVDANQLRWSWTAYLGTQGLYPSGGGRWVRVNARMFDTARGAASYAAKYVGKAVDEMKRVPGVDRGSRYIVGRGCVRPEPVYSLLIGDDMSSALEELFGGLLPQGCRVVRISDPSVPPAVWAGW